MRFIEGSLGGDSTCWFVPNPPAVAAMIRASGFRIEKTAFLRLTRCLCRPFLSKNSLSRYTYFYAEHFLHHDTALLRERAAPFGWHLHHDRCRHYCAIQAHDGF